jgi:hypothetical protein
VIDAVASDYQDRIAFVAVAGRSSESASRTRVGVWFDPARILWGYSDEIWGLFGVPGQPRTILISGDDVIVGGWFGAKSEEELRSELDRLADIG